MNICMIVHQDYYRDGRVRRYVETLITKGISVDVICVESTTSNTNNIDTNIPNIMIYSIPIRRSYAGLSSYLTEYVIALILYTFKLLGLYFKHRYDVIHIHNMPDFLVFAALIPRLFGAKLLLDIHDPTPEFFMSKYNRSVDSLMVKILRLQERLSIALAHHVITANHNFKHNLIARKIPEDKITVIQNFPDPKIFDPSKYSTVNKDDRFTMIYPGTLAPRYGLDIAINAIPFLKKTIPDIRLRIIGQQVDYAEELKNLVKDLKIENNVEFIPLVPIEKIPRYMTQAHIGIYTAIPDPHMDIATPSKVMEYAFMQLPIVAPDITILRTMFDENAILFFEPRNVKDFAQKILTLYKEPKRQEVLIKCMNETFVNNHSWDHESQRYLLILKTMTESSLEADKI